MDWLTFISKLIGDLAWPAVVIVLIWYLRPHLGSLAKRLEELSLPGGASAKFRKELEEAKEQAAPVLDFGTPRIDTRHTTIQAPMGGEDQFIQLAAMFPEAAISQSYQEIERIIGDHAAGINLRRDRPMEVVRHLQELGLVDRATVGLFNRLRVLRNEAAHNGGRLRLSLDEAIEYRALCRSLADALDFAFQKLKGKGGEPTSSE